LAPTTAARLALGVSAFMKAALGVRFTAGLVAVLEAGFLAAGLLAGAEAFFTVAFLIAGFLVVTILSSPI
jgi:hypothetical protein